MSGTNGGLWWLGVVWLVACGQSEREENALEMTIGLTGGSPGVAGGTADGAMPKLDVGDASDAEGVKDGNSGDGGACPCQNVLDGIYVLNTSSPPSVWFYSPPANEFSEVGAIGCDASLGFQPNSMAIDRAGYAWLNYYNAGTQQGKLFRAPLNDLAMCEEREYANTPGEWFLLGMGYATINASSSCDELFIYKSDRYFEYPNFAPGGAELARFNESSDVLNPIGATDYPVGELTGTGNGKLFAFGPVDASQAVLVELDKSTGAELENIPLPGLDITSAFAFAFWGGDVYFFTETVTGSGTSKVTRYDYDGNADERLAVYNDNAGIHIAGAGVSTCASFVPPG